MANLTCSDCGYSNEPQRVYCHSCGARLDRTLLPETEEEKKRESPEKARKRIKKMTNPSKGAVTREIKAFFKTFFWAAACAALIQAIRPPDNVPENKRELGLRMIPSEMMDLMQSPTPRAIAFPEHEVNLYLKQSLKGKDGPIPGVRFERAFVHFRPGVVHIASEQSVFGWFIYSGVDYKLEFKDGKLTPVLIAGNFGRMPVHPEAMKYLGIVFDNLWTALKRDHDQVSRMQSITITEGQIMMVTKGGAAP